MKVLIIGAKGMLAHEVIAELDGFCEISSGDLPECDIRDAEVVGSVVRDIRPDIIINCAAYTDVDGCEREQEQAFAVNAEGVKNIAVACRETGVLLYHVSSDFVFDGTKRTPYTEDDDVGPLSVYGRSKLAGEQYIRKLLSRYVIVRTSWLFGRAGRNFVTTILKFAEEREELRIVNDQAGCPTYAVDLARAIKSLLNNAAQGMYHICNSGTCTWYDFASEIVKLAGYKTRIVPITSAELARPASRPQYSAMDCSRIMAATGFRPRPWQEALQEYIFTIQGKRKQIC